MLSFDSVEVLIYDPVPSNRTATRAALYALGFRLTTTVSTLDAFAEAVQKTPPDIALCEAQGSADELCAIIQQMRQGGAGYNPFIVIIVTAWEKTSALINKVVSSGADDLLLRPFSTALLGQRIEAHIDRRKGFVITSDYVGPERRKDAAADGERFEPPNSLKMKVKDKLSGEAIVRRLDAELKTAREKLISEKLRRDSVQVCVLGKLLQDAPAEAPELGKLQSLARSIEARVKDTALEPAVEHCQSVLAAADAFGADRAALPRLQQAGLSLHEVFHPGKSTADRQAEIEAAVSDIRTRQQPEALVS